MRESLSCVRGQVIDDVEPPTAPQRGDEITVAKIALDPLRARIDVLAKAAREVIGCNDVHAGGQTVIDDMRSDEPRRPGDEDTRAGRRRPQTGGLAVHGKSKLSDATPAPGRRPLGGSLSSDRPRSGLRDG